MSKFDRYVKGRPSQKFRLWLLSRPMDQYVKRGRFVTRKSRRPCGGASLAIFLC